jgi:8-oxo-dGTP diphosphatase
MEIDETLEEGVVRELAEETGVTGVALEQMHTFSTIDRDPRGRMVTTVFWGEAQAADHIPTGMDDADDAAWWPFDALPPLACDHGAIIAHAVARLRARGQA